MFSTFPKSEYKFLIYCYFVDSEKKKNSETGLGI